MLGAFQTEMGGEYSSVSAFVAELDMSEMTTLPGTTTTLTSSSNERQYGNP
jgi:hypothetical protein